MNNKTGILVDPMNVEELTRAIEFMIDNPMKIIEFGKEGLVLYGKNLKYKKHSDTLREV